MALVLPFKNKENGKKNLKQTQTNLQEMYIKMSFLKICKNKHIKVELLQIQNLRTNE